MSGCVGCGVCIDDEDGDGGVFIRRRWGMYMWMSPGRPSNPGNNMRASG